MFYEVAEVVLDGKQVDDRVHQTVIRVYEMVKRGSHADDFSYGF